MRVVKFEITMMLDEWIPNPTEDRQIDNAKSKLMIVSGSMGVRQTSPAYDFGMEPIGRPSHS